MAENARMYLPVYEIAVVEVIKWGYCLADADAHKIVRAESELVQQSFEFGQMPIDCSLTIMRPIVKAKALP